MIVKRLNMWPTASLTVALAAALCTTSVSQSQPPHTVTIAAVESGNNTHEISLMAESIYLNGLLGSSIAWGSVTKNGKQLCGPKCTNMAYVALPTQGGLKSGVDLLYKWVTDPARTDGDTVYAYSLGTDVAIAVLRQLAAEGKTIPKMHWVFFGSPETPGHRATVVGYKGVEGLPAGKFDNVDFIVVKYDLFADPTARFGVLSFMNAVLTTHVFGYNGLDLSKPDYIHVDPVSGATTYIFEPKVLPLLQLASLIFPKEVIDAWTAVLKPLIDADYDRDWLPAANATMAEAGKTVAVALAAPESTEVKTEPVVTVAEEAGKTEQPTPQVDAPDEQAVKPTVDETVSEAVSQPVKTEDEAEADGGEATQETADPTTITKSDTESESEAEAEAKEADESDDQQVDDKDATKDESVGDKESKDTADDESAKTKETAKDTTKDESDSKRKTAESKDNSSATKPASKDTSSSTASDSKSSSGGGD